MSNVTTPYYGPVGETPDEILLEKTFVAAGYLTGFGFGVQLVLYAACMHGLWKRKPHTGFIKFLMFHTTMLCAMNAIWTGTSAYGVQITYVDNRNYPGGPFGFLLVESPLPTNVLSNVGYTIANIMADALLLWRCQVIWKASVGPKGIYFMIFPGLMLLASLAMQILFVFEAASPDAGFFSSSTVSFVIPWFSISLSLNIILTAMIVGQMIRCRKRGQAVFGSSYGDHYGSISSIFIESAAIYSICSTILLITYAMNHPINQIWLAIGPAVQNICNYLIIYRVIQGRAWKPDTFTSKATLTSMVFDTRNLRANQDSTTRNAHTDESKTIDVPLHYMTSKDNMKRNGVEVLRTVDIHSEESDSPMKWAAEGEAV
ncbi:unnamed protein product [Somion occarium]|uniref:Uncharacterized protein n=1 Tax=Somion occarium TaxID=3059160 RepID=A0ABP1CPI6_9APHY